jgi:hypothetical protein
MAYTRDRWTIIGLLYPRAVVYHGSKSHFLTAANPDYNKTGINLGSFLQLVEKKYIKFTILKVNDHIYFGNNYKMRLFILLVEGRSQERERWEVEGG